MRRRIPYRVCRCLPNGVVPHLEARLLKDLVNREIHPIRCAASCKRKFQKAMYLGDLCAETGHFGWAMKIWYFASGLIQEKDYDDWRYVWFNTDWVCLRDVISETECELLDRRCSDLWRALGYPECGWWDKHWDDITRNTFGTYYTFLWLEKYDYSPLVLAIEWEEEIESYRKRKKTEQQFHDGLPDFIPPSSQNIFEYWHGEYSIDPFE